MPRTTTESRCLLYGSFLFAVFVGTLGIATVWMRYQTSSTAARIRDHEQRTAELQRRSEELEGQVAALLLPEYLQRQNAQFALGLVPTDEPGVIRVSESVTRRLAAKRNRELMIAAPMLRADARGALAVADAPEIRLR